MPRDPRPSALGALAGGPRQEALFLLRRLTTDVEAFARGFGSAHGLRAHDVRALVLVIDAARAGTPLGPGALAERLGLSSASTTAVLDRLEHAGHVSRLPHPADRRKVVVEPTELARQEGRRWFGAMNLDLLEVLQAFDDTEVDVVVRVLEAMVGTVEDHLGAHRPTDGAGGTGPALPPDVWGGPGGAGGRPPG